MRTGLSQRLLPTDSEEFPEEGTNKTFNFFKIPPCGISGCISGMSARPDENHAAQGPRFDSVRCSRTGITSRTNGVPPEDCASSAARSPTHDLDSSASRGMLNFECFQLSLTSAAVPRRPQRTSIDVAIIAIATVRNPIATKLSCHG
jgi:hypothetical protein